MPDSASAPISSWVPQSSAEQEEIREQLKRVLSHPLFQNSQRIPAMLHYIVEKTLEGSAPQLKERVIGVEIFGRKPSYNANDDPVVRMVAREIRKRLAQYYADPIHDREVHIKLRTGSYVPLFSPVDLSAPVLDRVGPEPIAESPVQDPPASSVNNSRQRSLKLGFWLGSTVLIIAAALLPAWWMRHQGESSGPLDSFWAPVLRDPGMVTFCVGVPSVGRPTTILGHEPGNYSKLENELLHAGQLAVGDVVAIAHVTPMLASHQKPYRILPATVVHFAQLEEGPNIFIGAYDNPWAVRLTQNLRYSFAYDDTLKSAWIGDRQHPGPTSWSFKTRVPPERFSKDYALVVRFHDPTTNRSSVIVGGFSEWGTQAAGEFLSNPSSFSSLMHYAPHNWQNMNAEIVLETQIIDDNPGPARIVAVEFWQ
jgi:hypothetical protein